MEVLFALTTLLAQTGTEPATITISIGTAAIGGAVGGGMPLATILGWLGIKKWRNGKNGNGSPKTAEVLQQLVQHMADAKEERAEDRALRQEMLKANQEAAFASKEVGRAIQELDRRDARMEDRLDLVYDEVRELKKK